MEGKKTPLHFKVIFGEELRLGTTQPQPPIFVPTSTGIVQSRMFELMSHRSFTHLGDVSYWVVVFMSAKSHTPPLLLSFFFKNQIRSLIPFFFGDSYVHFFPTARNEKELFRWQLESFK